MEFQIKAPQIGEAVHSVNILRYLKDVGDMVEVDEPIVTLETHKTALDIESPVAGKIKAFLYPEGACIPVGETIVLLLTAPDGLEKKISASLKQSSEDKYQAVDDVIALRKWLGRKRNALISPRDKAHYLRNKVVPIALFREYNGAKADDDNKQEVESTGKHFVDFPISKSQALLNQTLSESVRQVVAANVQMLCDNTPIERYRKLARQKNQNVVPSRLELIAWAIVRSLRSHKAFCSRLLDSNKIRQFHNPNLGIALALPDDGLTTAVVRGVFSYDFSDFIHSFRSSVSEAKEDGYVTGYHSLSISDLSAYGVMNGIPIIAAPATATLFIGKPYLKDADKNLFQLSLTVDHRIINGVGAAHFLRSICDNLGKTALNI